MLCEFLGGSGSSPSVGMTPGGGHFPRGRFAWPPSLSSSSGSALLPSAFPVTLILPDILGWDPQLRSEGGLQVVRSSRNERSFQAELRGWAFWVPQSLGSQLGPEPPSLLSLCLGGTLGVRWLMKSRADGFLLGCCPGKRPEPKYIIQECTPVSPNTANGSRSK